MLQRKKDLKILPTSRLQAPLRILFPLKCRRTIWALTISVIICSALLVWISWNAQSSNVYINIYQIELISSSSEEHVNDDWDSVSKDIYIYSAYWDSREAVPNTPFVRVIAIAQRMIANEPKLKCILRYGNTQVDTNLTKVVIAENWSKKHSASFFICKPPINTIPNFVSLTIDRFPTKWKRVKIVKKTLLSKPNLAVCVRPFFGPFNQTSRLSEFIAFYTVMGVTKYTFYDYETSKFMKEHIENLILHNVTIDLLPWSLPKDITIWENGQLAFIQDCIYRHMMEAYEFVMIVDVDEFIVPRQNITLLQLVEKDSKKIGSFQFRNTFFCEGKKSNQTEGTDLRIGLWLERENFVWGQNQRSKVIVRPTGILSSGIHAVQNFVNGFSKKVIDPQHALLHHYHFDGLCDPKKATVIDKSALQFWNATKDNIAVTI